MRWLFACVGGGSGDGVAGDSAGDSGPLVGGPPAPVAYSGGTCPDMKNGEMTITSDGIDREIILKLPGDPSGAPVWFNWHWLGGSASDAVRYQGLKTVKQAGYIVVVPESRDGMAASEWGFIGDGSQAGPDLALFDDVLSCLDEQYDVDNSRVYTTGMSAGGLWSTYLVMHRSEYLAAAAPLSGGTGVFVDYTEPARDMPVLLTWGDANDKYNGLSFDDASKEFEADLVEDGHWVRTCVHTQGHVIPNEATDYTLQFFEDHPWGVDPVPGFGDASVYPSFCSEPE
ncbi:MAG: prolyl oligopeptidase family serine peptidase [Proteobacteria bacterium]|nr:prolyl oligopeptidase family serine peptidase [Pseudomonadota bacterium]MCP4917506.1 prolyl oligopeptidase family serine peptidase [Pseudomonadota bacterium]